MLRCYGKMLGMFGESALPSWQVFLNSHYSVRQLYLHPRFVLVFGAVKKLLCSLSVFLLLSACSVGPDYVRPPLEMPDQWRLGLAEAQGISNLLWWEQFNDPELSELIKVALDENKDLRIATATVEEFYAQFGATRSQLFPQTGLSSTYTRTRGSTTGVIPSDGRIFNSYVGDLNLSWEIDLWGRIRRATEAAKADLLSQEDARRAVLLTVVSSVATSYVRLRQLDRQLEIAQGTLTSRKGAYKVAKERFDAGLTSELDLRQAEAELADTETRIPIIEKQVSQAENLLSILVGRNPGTIRRGRSIDEINLTKAIPSGIPSAILEQRPDIVAAEERLIAANARIGAVRAEYFPTFSLTGLFGFASRDLSDWLHSPSRQWQYGPGINLPLFNAGAVGNRVEVAKAQHAQALVGYQKAIQNGLREVEDSLVGRRKSLEEQTARERQVKVLSRYLELAQASYKEGQTAYLDVLDAQRKLFEGEIQLTSAQGDAVLSVIELYRALGGGWIVEADKHSAGQPEDVSTLF